MHDWIFRTSALLEQYLVPFGLKLFGALGLWWAGSWLIGLAVRACAGALAAQRVDPALSRYLTTGSRLLLRLTLVLAVLALFGIQTTSIVALLAAAAFAIGAAWSGLLANFAAGALLLVLKPFRVGDTICAAGVTGEVRGLGLFATLVDTPDNVRVLVGNHRILSDNVINYSVNAYRRVDLTAQLPHGVNARDAMELLGNRIRQVQNVVSTPAPQVDILAFNPAGTLLAVRPYCHNKDYWQVYFDANHAIQAVMLEQRYAIPAPHQVIIQQDAPPSPTHREDVVPDSRTDRPA